MKDPIAILLCALSLLACSKECISKSLSELSGKVIQRTVFPQTDTSINRLHFLAILFRYKNSQLTEEGLTFAAASVLTPIHAITSATCVDDYLGTNFESITLKFDGFRRESACTHTISNITPHPRYNKDTRVPFANIAIIFVNVPFENSDIRPLPRIPLSLHDIENDVHFQRVSVHLGTGWNSIWPKVVLGDSHTVRDAIDKTVLHSNPQIRCSDEDDSAPIVSSDQLVGITSKVNSGKKDVFTKIYNFLPFILYQLQLDTPLYKDPAYDPHKWIGNALSIPLLANAQPEEIL